MAKEQKDIKTAETLNPEFLEVPAIVQIPKRIESLFLTSYSPETVLITDIGYGDVKELTFKTYLPMETKHYIVRSAISLGRDDGQYYSYIIGMIMFLQYYLEDSSIIIEDISDYDKATRFAIFDFIITSGLLRKIEEQCPQLFEEAQFIADSISARYADFLQRSNTAKEIIDQVFFKLGEGLVDFSNSIEGMEKSQKGTVNKMFAKFLG